MSSSTLVAKRYANALFQLAKEKNTVAKVEQDLKLISEVMQKEPALADILSYPAIKAEEKRALLDTLFAKAIDQSVLNTLQLLCDRRRAGVIAELAEYFSRIASRELGQVDALVISVSTLEAKQVSEVQKKFAELLGKEVRITEKIDTSLIGGIQVRIGDTLYDGSIAGKLARLEKALQESQAL